jgi:hypothetical protein
MKRSTVMIQHEIPIERSVLIRSERGSAWWRPSQTPENRLNHQKTIPSPICMVLSSDINRILNLEPASTLLSENIVVRPTFGLSDIYRGLFTFDISIQRC